jgi:hypothetical protein
MFWCMLVPVIGAPVCSIMRLNNISQLADIMGVLQRIAASRIFLHFARIRTLKSADRKRLWEFKSPSGHQYNQHNMEKTSPTTLSAVLVPMAVGFSCAFGSWLTGSITLGQELADSLYSEISALREVVGRGWCGGQPRRKPRPDTK